jgi:hypothetical protein
MSASGAIDGADQFLFCGRMAHAITYRTMANSGDNVTPAAGDLLSEWRKETIEAVAALYGVTVDRETCIVKGKGAPIGYPRLEYQATPAEEKLFESVNRDSGDSLLAISWMPTAPEGW